MRPICQAARWVRRSPGVRLIAGAFALWALRWWPAAFAPSWILLFVAIFYWSDRWRR